MPAATFLGQLFLGFGWLRAATAHGIDPSWWSGDYLTRFLAEETDMAVGIYEPFLSEIVGRLPAVTALIVFVIELVVGMLLVLNIRALRALLAGVFLNLNFVLAGVVNPSVFYLVIALVIMMWRMERALSPENSRKWVRGTATATGIVAVILVPYITTLSPHEAIEDPALVLIFLTALFAAATWWTHQRIALSTRTFEQLGL